MPAIVRTEFALALNQVAMERGINVDIVLDSIKAAILAAYRKDYLIDEEHIEEYSVTIHPTSGEARIFKGKEDITPPGFGRIAAQTAKQVILQKIREAEKGAIMKDYAERIDTIVSGMILRFDGPNIMVDIGRAQGVMPPSEQSRSEKYHINQRLTFYIKEIREGKRGSEIILSRAHPNLVIGLFRREVPEVANKSVDIREIAREAGFRTKIAVYSAQHGVDPVGSCVGQKGVRVQTVINELGQDEKIDVIQWNPDPVGFITASLAPAKDFKITINEEEKKALVMAPDDQLSMAIGREGQNVRLASCLTGYSIDIRSKNPPTEKKEEEKVSNVSKVPEVPQEEKKEDTKAPIEASELEKVGLGRDVSELLKKKNITTVDQLKALTNETMLAIEGLTDEMKAAIKKVIAS